MTRRLILILGDQLTPEIAGLRAGDPRRDVVVMAEVMDEAGVVPHHPQKIALIFAAMRKFAAALRAAGWRVAYTRLDDPDNTQSIRDELVRRCREHRTEVVHATQPGDVRLDREIRETSPFLKMHGDDRFICPTAVFRSWSRGRKVLRMEHFYREMRRRTGLLMEGDRPAGGQWNFDHDNRKPAEADLFRAPPLRFEPDRVTEEVLDLVEARFGHHFGRLRPFGWATDRAGALQALDHFIRHALPRFGDEQDAMLASDPHLSHSLLSPYLNLGLLSPMEVCLRAEAEWKAGRAPLNAVEGFIRQIIGWREFVRGVYLDDSERYMQEWAEHPDRQPNPLGHRRRLPPLYWGAPTRMACMAAAVAQTRDLAYAHHIQRLMVTGNFALLAGINPWEVNDWYLSVYIDALEWVEAPNTIGMSQFADGGRVASKPYAASGAYIDRMSDYCKGCHYSVTAKTGEGACPFNLLYWHFVDRHNARFASNPRVGPVYRNWHRMDPDRRAAILQGAEDFLARLDAGEPV